MVPLSPFFFFLFLLRSNRPLNSPRVLSAGGGPDADSPACRAEKSSHNAPLKKQLTLGATRVELLWEVCSKHSAFWGSRGYSRPDRRKSGKKKPPQQSCDGALGVRLFVIYPGTIFPARYRNTSPWPQTSLTNVYLLPLRVWRYRRLPVVPCWLAINRHNLSIGGWAELTRNSAMIFCYFIP